MKTNDDKTICLDKSYSTTRCLTRQKPEIVNRPEDKLETKLFMRPNKARRAEGGLRSRGLYKKSTPKKLLITIVTVVYNGEAYLEETILSVLNQTYDNVEYIIIDGGSTDDTLKIIKKYEEAIDYFISEPDGGIYYAMNKGLGLALGRIIGLINADDGIYPEIIEKITGVFANHFIGFVYGNINILNEEGKICSVRLALAENKWAKEAYFHMPFCHQSLFVSLSVYKHLGVFNPKFSLSADYDFILRLLEKNVPKIKVNDIIGYFRTGGQSGGLTTWLQTAKILKHHDKGFLHISIFLILSLSKFFLKKILPAKIFYRIRKLKKSDRYSYLT
jgi:glycosyltransferase involved in cell wall biosynthesis